LRSRDF